MEFYLTFLANLRFPNSVCNFSVNYHPWRIIAETPRLFQEVLASFKLLRFGVRLTLLQHFCTLF